MGKQHNYSIRIQWTGNKGTGTSGYREYDRSHLIRIEGKTDIEASSDSAFRGDKTKHNPEDLLVAALSECHMLWYLHLCADAGVIVIDYIDQALGIMEEDENGGRFISVKLNPVVIVKESSMVAQANALHDLAHRKCFITNSVNFPVTHNPVCRV